MKKTKVEKEVIAALPGKKWQILNEEEANKHHLRLINIDEDNVLLTIDLRNIPNGVTVLDFIDMIQQTGIVICYDRQRQT